jgi:predicted amidohydrolase
VESQLYMCATNCTGSFKNDRFYGHSLLVSPQGEIIAEGSAGEEIIYCTAEMDAVAKTRAAMSVLKDVRWELYQA